MTPHPLSPLARLFLYGCFALLGVIAFVTIRTWYNPPISKNTLERIVSIEHDTVRHWDDAAGRDHGTTRLAEADVTSLRVVYPFIDSVLRTLSLQGKQLQALTALSSTTAGTVRPRVDTVLIREKAYPHFVYRDRWLDLDGVLADTPLIKYSTFDSLIVTTYSKRKWLLGKKETFVDAYSLNPASKIGGLTGLRVATERSKRFGLGPYIGYGYDGLGWKPSIGVSLQYSLIKF